MAARNSTVREPSIEVLPADVRAWLLLAFCCLLAMAIVAIVMQWRTGRLLARERRLCDDRVREYERVADELNDMLVQSIQGFTLTVRAAANLVHADNPARAMLDRSLERAEEVLAEARDRVEESRRRVRRDRSTIAADGRTP